MAGNARTPGRTVTDRVLSVLTAFEHGPHALTLTEIASRADLAPSTAHRLLGELVESGFLTRTPQGRYQLGLRLWELGQSVGRRLRETARPFVQELHAMTGQTAQLAIRDGAEALYIERAYGTQRVPRASRVGGRLPLHVTAVGKAILAFEEEWVRASYLELELESRTPRSITDPARLARQLETARAEGYATTVEEVRAGACSIAVPVFHRSRVGASLGLVLSAELAPRMGRFLPALRNTAGQLQQATESIPLESLWQAHEVRRSSPSPPLPPEGGHATDGFH